METDIVRKRVVDYQRKANSAKRQQTELQTKIDTARRHIIDSLDKAA